MSPTDTSMHDAESRTRRGPDAIRFGANYVACEESSRDWRIRHGLVVSCAGGGGALGILQSEHEQRLAGGDCNDLLAIELK